MGDGPPANLPAGLDAYGGYVNVSGIGETWPAVEAMPAAHHLPITTNGSVADCADVENGAMSSWAGYPVGYASASRIGDLILSQGRPRKLWVAHGTDVPHLCTSDVCWPSSPVRWTADGTQWGNHGGLWDESLLLNDFFDYRLTVKGDHMPFIAADTVHTYLVADDLSRKVIVPDPAEVGALRSQFPALPSDVPSVLASIPLATAATAAQGPDPT